MSSSRSITQDVARKLDTCAYATTLERTQHGPFTSSMALHEPEWTADGIQQAIDRWQTTMPQCTDKRPHP
jgi:tRNA U55 pseudouridine synthase TruB